MINLIYIFIRNWKDEVMLLKWTGRVEMGRKELCQNQIFISNGFAKIEIKSIEWVKTSISTSLKIECF